MLALQATRVVGQAPPAFATLLFATLLKETRHATGAQMHGVAIPVVFWPLATMSRPPIPGC